MEHKNIIINIKQLHSLLLTIQNKVDELINLDDQSEKVNYMFSRYDEINLVCESLSQRLISNIDAMDMTNLSHQLSIHLDEIENLENKKIFKLINKHTKEIWAEIKLLIIELDTYFLTEWSIDRRKLNI